MVKKHLLFLFFQVKSTLRALPKLVICTAIFAAAVLVLGACGSAYFGGSPGKPLHIKVAAVMPEDDPSIALAFRLITKMDSVQAVCEFERPDIDTALSMLDSGEVSAVIVIPDGFIDGLMYGENIPAKLILPENAGMESLFFSSLMGAGIYAVGDLLNTHGYSYLSANAQDELYNYYITCALNRVEFFKSEKISPTGNVSLAGYYICSGIVLMLLLGGMTVADCFSNRPAAVMESLRASGISKAYIRLCELCGVTFMFFVLFTAVLAAAGVTSAAEFISLTPVGIPLFLLLSASVSCFIMFLCCIADSGIVSVLVMFLSTALMMYACGRIVPAAYLPAAIEKFGRILPVYGWCGLAESIISGHFNAHAVVMTAVYGLVFAAVSVTATVIRGRDR